jgi:hypothetical protein
VMTGAQSRFRFQDRKTSSLEDRSLEYAAASSVFRENDTYKVFKEEGSKSGVGAQAVACRQPRLQVWGMASVREIFNPGRCNASSES